ncbi:hypothetical protein ROLI_017900 [Roseobacter fucihabitans]|uniref:Uncharacterized protein n=1 Tax=Roseobacter fucihabitans TaxID=1537242 RepID=A0ABZ2BRS7_9RHOB|nr:hypothetical protein [Roseobacter litoralis]MBC6965549.1 hypothetical protein [Roseobacter litoralis]
MENTQTPFIFELLIWGGAALSLIGLFGLLWCILYVARARRAKLDDTEMRAKLRKALPMNLAALFLSVIGLMLVILGIFLS